MTDVAEWAGVSPMSVSRVINGGTKVREVTRDKVLEAIRFLGYVPNPAARTLAGARPYRIALLHSNPSAAYLSEFLMGTLNQAETGNAQLLVEHCDTSAPAEHISARLAEHRIEAILLPPPLCDDRDLLEALRARGFPIAQIATGCPLAYAHAVSIDDEGAAYAMTRHLIALGHERIGFIAGKADQTVSSLRHHGYMRAVCEAGRRVDPTLMAQGDFTYRSGLVAAERLLARHPRPTAIFASNDDMAAATAAVAHGLGLRIPQDLSIAGYDDTLIATTIWPQLTTIRQPIREMARLGTQLLIKAIHDKRAKRAIRPDHRSMMFELVRRTSDGPHR